MAGCWRGSEKDAARLRWAFATQNGNGSVLLGEKRQMESDEDNLKQFESMDVNG